MDAGFLFDFSTAPPADDNDDVNVQKRISADTPTTTVCSDSAADFMIVPKGSECRFEFLSVEQVIAEADSVLRKKQRKDDETAMQQGDTGKANNEAVVFLETVLPFRRDQKGKDDDDVAPAIVSIFHRQAPKVDVLEVVSTNKHNNDNDKITDATDKRRDIVQGAYYGGLKVWSCAPDVAETVIFGAVENEGVAAADDEDSTDSSDEQQPQQEDATRQGTQQRIDFFGDEVRKLINNVNKSSSSSSGGSASIAIAELGCGQSLPTLGVMHRLLSSNLVAATSFTDEDTSTNGGNNNNSSSNHVLVFLHDYNKEVIAEVTLPNVAHALLQEREKTNNKNKGTTIKWAETNLSFATGYGDWDVVAPSSFLHPILNPEGCVDILLAADVTFDMEATEKFLVAAARILRPPTSSSSSCDGGLAIVGTKDYYFGTNGGLVEMREVIRKKRLPLKLTVVGKRGVGTMIRVLVVLRRV